MYNSTKVLSVLSSAAMLIVAAGCTQTPSQQGASTSAAPATTTTQMSSDPELAGAWYQIYFDTGKADINARGQMVIKNVAYVATNNDMTRVTVIGKTDRVGSAPINMALSQQRADHVRDALIAAGVPSSHINARWTGESQQAVPTNDDANEQLNRCVDIMVIKLLPRKM